MWYVLFWLLSNVHTTCCLTTSETIWGVPEYQKNFVKKGKKILFLFCCYIWTTLYTYSFLEFSSFCRPFFESALFITEIPLYLYLLQHFYPPKKERKAFESQCDFDLNNNPSRVECPRLWRITKNSLHNEGTYRVNWVPIFFWYLLLMVLGNLQNFDFQSQFSMSKIIRIFL